MSSSVAESARDEGNEIRFRDKLQGSEPTTDYRLQLQYNTQKIMTTTTSPAEKPDYNYKSAQLTDYNYRLQLFNLKPARPGISRVVPGLYIAS